MKIIRSGMAVLSLALLLGACGSSGGGGSGGPGLVFGDLLVKGRVVTAFGGPAANLSVWVAGRGPFTTDINGEFIVDRVPEPYDVVVLEADEVYVQVWDGLTLAEPLFTLPPFDDLLSPTSTGAKVEGTVTGPVALPVPATHETLVTVPLERSGAASLSTDADPTTGDYSANVVWLERVLTVEGRLVAYQYLKDVDDAPSVYTGWGEMPISVNAGETIVGQNIVMSPVATTSISGMVNLPPGLGVAAYIPFLEYTTGELLTLPSRPSSDPMFAEKIPEVTDTSRGLFLISFSPSDATVFSIIQDLPAPTIGETLDLPEPTVLLLPFDGVTDVDYDTVLTATPSVGDRVLTVSFTPVGDGPQIDLITMNTTFTIPDLTDLGLGIPPGAEYKWDVRATSPLTSVDGAATPRKFIGIGSLPASLNPAHISSGPARTFTFAD